MEQIKYYMAPMEGVTGYVFRNAYAKYYGGIERYFTPFVANKKLGHREKNDVCPEHNAGMAVVPQILTNRAEDFLAIAEILREYGYDTVNLNLGCPSGTVAARGRGAGFLAMPDELDHFLEEIFEKCPLRISIKTRIGKENPAEWERLLAIYEKYPREELIEECVFLDDRQNNVDGAIACGISAIRFTGYEDARQKLKEYGVEC